MNTPTRLASEQLAAIKARVDSLVSLVPTVAMIRYREDGTALLAHVAAVEAEAASLRAIVGPRIPATADGVYVDQGDEVWFPGEDRPFIVGGENSPSVNLFMAGNRESGDEVAACYSTKAAAEAARKEAGR